MALNRSILTIFMFLCALISSRQLAAGELNPLNVVNSNNNNNNDELTFGVTIPAAAAASGSPPLDDGLDNDENDDDSDDDDNVTMSGGQQQQQQQQTSTGSSSSSTSEYLSTAASRLNKTHAGQFKAWLEIKSSELFAMTRNFSGFELLNETYNVRLPKESNFSWINFTDMIVNISKSISEVKPIFFCCCFNLPFW